MPHPQEQSDPVTTALEQSLAQDTSAPELRDPVLSALESSLAQDIEGGNIDLSNIPSQSGQLGPVAGFGMGAKRGFFQAFDPAIRSLQKRPQATILGGPGGAIADYLIESLSPTKEPQTIEDLIAERAPQVREPATEFAAQIGAINPEISFEDLSRAGRVGYRAGEVVGESAPFAIGGAGVTAGRAGLKQAAKFAAVETGTMFGSAQGSALAESFFPGNDAVRLTAEIGGGFVAPSSLVARVAGGPIGGVTKAVQSFSRAGRENNARKAIIAALRDNGEDVETIRQALLSAEEAGVSLTSAVKTDSPALKSLEAFVAKRSPEFGALTEESTRQSLNALNTAAENLRKTGTPEALRAAAIAKSRYYRALLSSRAASAEKDAAAAAARFDNTPGQKAAASTRVHQVLSESQRAARRSETELWNKIPSGVEIQPRGLGESLANARERLLDTEQLPLPAPIRQAIDNAMEGGVIQSGQLLKLKSRVLTAAREARSRGDFNEAATLDIIHSGLIEDLGKIPGPEADEARAFSRAYHEAFTQTFAGKALSRADSGAYRISPETLLERAFAGRGTAPASRFAELENAARFGNRDEPYNMLFSTLTRNEQESFLRSAAGELLDERGVVNPTKLQSFMHANQEVLARFPKLAEEFQNAGTLASKLKRYENLQNSVPKAIKQKAVFAKVAGTEDVVGAVSKVIYGENPARGMKQMARLAQKTGPEAVGGLRTSVIDAAYRKAVGAGENIDFQKFHDELFEPQGRGRPALIDLMRKEGVIANQDSYRLQALLKRAANIQEAAATPGVEKEFLDPVSGFMDFAIRGLGVKFGTESAKLFGISGAPTLHQAGGGSRLARNIFEKVPATRMTDVLTEAAADPKFMAKLLENPPTIARKRELNRQINAFLIQAGIVPDEEEAEFQR